MQAHAVQRIAEDKRVPDFSVIEWFDSEVVSRAEKFLVANVPDRKRKIAAQVLHAFFLPGGVRVQDQIGICYRPSCFSPGAFELRAQFSAAIDSRVRGDPKSAVEARRLALIQRFSWGPEQRVVEA